MSQSVSQPATETTAAALFVANIYFSTLVCLSFLVPSIVAGEALIQIGSIPLKGVEGRLDHLTFDPRSQRLFIAALENHTIEVVDLKTRHRAQQIRGVSEPQGLLYIPERNRLLVCCRGDGTCRSFDGTTFQEGPWIDLGRNADNLRFDAEAQVIYVGSGGEPGNGLLSGIDLVSLLPARQGGRPAPPYSPADFLLDRPRQADPSTEIQLPAHPESFQLDRAAGRILVNVPDEHQVEVLQVGTNGLIKLAFWPVTVGEKNFPMALDATSARLFIACRKPPLLAVYDTRTGSLLSQTRCVGDADDMFYDQSRRRIYVIGGEGFVDVFHIAVNDERPRRVIHLATHSRARTGLLIPEFQTLAVAAPHTGDGQASILLYQAKP